MDNVHIAINSNNNAHHHHKQYHEQYHFRLYSVMELKQTK
jgi:hypothetical protein